MRSKLANDIGRKCYTKSALKTHITVISSCDGHLRPKTDEELDIPKAPEDICFLMGQEKSLFWEIDDGSRNHEIPGAEYGSQPSRRAIWPPSATYLLWRLRPTIQFSDLVPLIRRGHCAMGIVADWFTLLQTFLYDLNVFWKWFGTLLNHFKVIRAPLVGGEGPSGEIHDYYGGHARDRSRNWINVEITQNRTNLSFCLHNCLGPNRSVVNTNIHSDMLNSSLLFPYQVTLCRRRVAVVHK